MGRPAKFGAEDILDTTATLIAEGGSGEATVAGIADRMGAPSGSIYHRFESRDLLMARLWIRTVIRAQEGFLDALDSDDVDAAAVQAALHVPRWARSHLAEAAVLVLYRREDLTSMWPDELGDELADLNRGLELAIREFTRRRFGRVTPRALDAVTFALVDVPYGATRRHLVAGRPPPPAVDELVARTVRCVLER